MLEFLLPKSKLQSFNFRQIPIETVEMLGVSQINPYCHLKFEEEIFFTLVNFSFESRKFDEKEGLILSKYFTLRRCPRCKKIHLIPLKMKINMDENYLKHDEEIAFDAYEEHPSRRNFPTTVEAYCLSCASCFEIRIKNKDTWIKEAKKIKEKELVTGEWSEFCID